MKEILQIFLRKFRSDLWLWTPSFGAIGFQWYFIFTFKYAVLPPIFWGIMFGVTTGIFFMNVLVILWLMKSKQKLTRLESPYLEDKWNWINDHCWFYYRRNRHEAWIPRLSIRLAFKLRWEE